MSNKLKTEAKNYFEKEFSTIHFLKKQCSPMFSVLVRKRRNIRLVTTDKRRSYLVSEPNCHTTKWFSENLLAIEVNKIKVKI